MNKLDANKVKIGARFKVFREIIDRTPEELAADLDTPVSEIKAIEEGRIFPKIVYLYYFYGHYGLNINWLIGNVGTMFAKKNPRKLAERFASKPTSEPAGQRKNEYLELLELMEIPVIRDSIMATLLEIKTLLKKEIMEANETSREPGSNY